MKQKIHYLFMLLLLLVTGVGGVKAETTYKLEKVTEVEAGGLYVFEQSEHVAINTVKNSVLQTTESYNTTGLTGTEAYVWELKNSTKGFKISSRAKVSNEITNSSSTNITLSAEGSQWFFNFQDDGTVVIQNADNEDRFLGYTSSTSYAYKAYAKSNLTSTTYPHAINVYKLVVSQPCTVILNDNGQSLIEASAGAGVELPTRSDVGVYSFLGWSEINVNPETTTKPEIIPAGNYKPVNNITLYPVYTRTETTGTPVENTASVTISEYATANSWSNDKQYKVVAIDENVSATASNSSGSNTGKYYTNGTNWRFYQNEEGKITISTTSGTLNSVKFTFTVSNTGTLNNNSSALTSGTAVSVSGSSAEFTVGNSGNATNGQVRITAIEVAYTTGGTSTTYYTSVPSGETPVQKVDVAVLNSITPTTLNVNDKGEFTLDATFAEGTTADEDYEVSWESDNAEVLAVSGASYEAKKEGTANVTVTVTVLDDEKYNEVSKSFAVTVNDPNAPGTQNNPYTVAQAIEYINTLGTSTSANDVYVKGIISQIDDYFENYKSITYWISDNGTTTNQLEVYSGKGLDGVDFSSITDLQLKDQVTVCGKVKLYKSTYEFDKTSKIVSFYRKEKVDAGLAWSAKEASAVRGETFAAPSLTNPNNVVVSYKSSNTKVATISEAGTISLLKAGETTITATFAGDDDYNAAEVSYKLTVTVPSHTATFFVNGQQQGEPATVAEDEAITFPTVVEELYGKKFVGWTTKAIDGEIKDKPATLVNAATMGTADVTYYAVYANMISGSSASLTKMTSSDTFGAGDKVVIVADNNVAMYQETIKSSYVNKYTFDGDVSKVAADDKNWFSVSAGSSDGTWKLGDETNGYVYTSSSNNLSIDSDNSTDFTLAWNNDENKFTLVGNGRWLSYRSDLAADNQYFRMGGATTGNSSGYIYFDIYKFTSGSATYSDYCTTVVAPVKPAKPIIFHDSGEYESELQIAMAGEGTIMYTLNDGEAQTYSAPFTIKEDATIKAWAVKDGVASDVTEPKTFTIKEKAKSAKVDDGYYTIQNNDGKYVNVAGRKTVTLVSDTKSAGTVIRVKADEYGVKVLRSQAVDLPRYAERAMSYVPELVKEVVKKLAANVDDPIIGEQGAELILDKFNKEFDYHLYLEGENNTYRIYGRTPSMKPVVDFYAENKELIDGRLLKVEGFVKEVLQKVVDKVGRGQSVVDMFKVKTIWQNMGGTLTEPTDDASTLKFYEEVLSSETNVWNFAYQTGMLYWEKVKGYLTENAGSLGDYGKYLEKIPNVRPNFKYYIVPGENGVDIISEGNSQITDASTAWTLTKRDGFDVTLPVEKVVNIYPTSSGGTTTTYNEYYGTLYTDFAYQLPADVVAYKIDGIDVVKGKAYIKKTKLENILPAQTPVMLVSNTADIELTLVAGDVAAVSEGELRGNDFLINEYEINSSQAEGIMMILQKLSESLYNEYEHLQRRNAGTVNNKYFFGLAVDPDLGDAYKAKTGNDMEKTPVRVLTKKEDGTIAFTESWNTLAGNESFIFNEEYSDILLSRVGDVNRDGQVTIADVTALVNIILGKATYPADADKYDFEAADVNTDKTITISDVTALVNIILGK